MISRHTLITLGAFGLIVGALVGALVVVGAAFQAIPAEGSAVLVVCPFVFFVPGGLLLGMGIRLSRRHGLLKGISGLFIAQREVPVREIAEKLRIDEDEAERLALMAVAEGYVTGSYDRASRTLRRRTKG